MTVVGVGRSGFDSELRLYDGVWAGSFSALLRSSHEYLSFIYSQEREYPRSKYFVFQFLRQLRR